MNPFSQSSGNIYLSNMPRSGLQGGGTQRVGGRREEEPQNSRQTEEGGEMKSRKQHTTTYRKGKTTFPRSPTKSQLIREPRAPRTPHSSSSLMAAVLSSFNSLKFSV